MLRKGLLVAAPVAAVLLSAVYLKNDQERCHDQEGGLGASAAVPVWHEASPECAPAFSVMQGSAATDAGTQGVAFLAEFRFAGTFFLYGADQDTAELRRGVLSCLPEHRQEIVSEGSVVNGVLVKALYEDRIVLEKDGQQGTLRLGSGEDDRALSSLNQAGTEKTDDRNRFGTQSGEGVWTLDKKALMDYYDELLDQPERLLQVFDSLRPLYGADGTSITGYTLQAVGERAFFDAVGFREGDVVRKVNALPMTNRGRAEFFIKQVVSDKLSAIVIDIEREGGPKRLVYQLR